MEMMASTSAGGNEYFDAELMTADEICSAFARASPNFCVSMSRIRWICPGSGSLAEAGAEADAAAAARAACSEAVACAPEADGGGRDVEASGPPPTSERDASDSCAMADAAKANEISNAQKSRLIGG